MIFTNDIYYCASYVPEDFRFAVLGTTQLLESMENNEYPVVKKVTIGNKQFISRSYDDVYLIPLEARIYHATEMVDIPLELTYNEYSQLKDLNLKDFQLDHENEILTIRYPLYFGLGVDGYINHKLYKGKLYKRIRLSDDGTIISDDWELIPKQHPDLLTIMDGVFGDVMKDFLFGQGDQPNITIN